MKKERYKRKPGDFEIRVLADGRVVMIAPDEALFEVARAVEPGNQDLPTGRKKKEHGRDKRRPTKQ